jgi:4-amino-4-deoxy-L-arabinose transferase-like glycosyltransferase
MTVSGGFDSLSSPPIFSDQKEEHDIQMHRFRLHHKFHPWLVSIFFLIIYLVHPTNLPYIDGLYYSYHVEHMPMKDTFHPHHLLFLTITQLIYTAIHSIITSLRGLPFYQILNSILAAVTVFYIYQLFLKLFKSCWGAFLAAFFYASTFGFWHHATDANIYISFNLLLTILLSRFLLDKEFVNPRHLFITAILTACATLVHQLGIFLLIPFGSYLLSHSTNRKENVVVFFRFLITYLSAVIIPYILAFVIFAADGSPSIPLFAKWVTAYGSNRMFWPVLYHDAGYVISVVARSQFESLFHVLPAQKIIFQGNQTGEGRSLLNLFNFILALILMLIIERVHYINYRADQESKHLNQKLLAWMMPFFIFFGFFAPENYFYRILYLAPLMIFASGLVISSTLKREKLKIILTLFVVFTFFYNALDGIIPESKKKNNPYYVQADAIYYQPPIGDDSLIIFAEEERYLAATFRYYFDQECLHAMGNIRYKSADSENIKMAKSETAEFINQKYKKVFLSTVAIEMGVETYYFSLNNFPPPHPQIMALDKDQMVQTGTVPTPYGTYFQVEIDKPDESNSSDENISALIE